MRHLGIDFGSKRVGLALSDENGMLAFPQSILQNDLTLVEHITTLCRDAHVGEIVIGESLDSSGRPNPIMQDVKAFAVKIGKATGLPIVFQKEYMTSLEARRPIDGKKALVARKEKIEQTLAADAKAAALILQRYLDKVHFD
ncbi:MAG: Holliday junction resolvase RuvX [Candidatus Pacebacteria bacterium]|jgi:putative Holliday junction resolvase|nr:Holliday junction resolvase RuvX [Candidatus Paceibacterota bacterium]